MQDLAGHRIEEGLGAFGLLVVDQHPDVVEFGAFPQRVGAGPVQARGAEFTLDARDRFQDAPVVEVDAIAGWHEETLRAPLRR